MSLTFALIGAGNIARVQIEAIKNIPGASVTVICNRTEETGRALAGTCGADWSADIGAAVSRDDVDIVSICTPSGAHLDAAVWAAQAGKHLMVEKPLEITLERIDQIIEAANANNVKLTCFFPNRFMSGVQKAKEAVAAGRLGQLVFADAFVRWFRDQAYYDVGWRGTWALDGGGALMNQSIHSIDLLQWLAGPVKNIYAHTTTLNHDIETEDTAAALLEFTQGGMGTIQGSTSCWPGDPAKIELHGTKGTIVLEEGRITAWHLADAQDGEEAAMVGLEQSSGSGSADPMGISYENHRQQMLDMINAIQHDREPLIPGKEARKAVEIILAIYESAKAGKKVNL